MPVLMTKGDATKCATCEALKEQASRGHCLVTLHSMREYVVTLQISISRPPKASYQFAAGIRHDPQFCTNTPVSIGMFRRNSPSRLFNGTMLQMIGRGSDSLMSQDWLGIDAHVRKTETTAMGVLSNGAQ